MLPGEKSEWRWYSVACTSTPNRSFNRHGCATSTGQGSLNFSVICVELLRLNCAVCDSYLQGRLLGRDTVLASGLAQNTEKPASRREESAEASYVPLLHCPLNVHFFLSGSHGQILRTALPWCTSRAPVMRWSRWLLWATRGLVRPVWSARGPAMPTMNCGTWSRLTWPQCGQSIIISVT